MFIGAILAKFLRPSAIMKISEKMKMKTKVVYRLQMNLLHTQMSVAIRLYISD